MLPSLVRGVLATPTVVVLVASLLAGCSAERAVAPVPADAPRPALSAAAEPGPRISEIHYDNAGTDAGEAVEVSFPAGTELTGWRIVRFNGSSPAAAVSYTSPAPLAGSSENLATLTPTMCGAGRAVVVVRYPQDGLQNGANDGLALVNGQTVVELLSYEGSFTVATTSTVAAGMTSRDIGVSQTGSSTLDPVGASLQRDAGNTWTRTQANTFGACNDGPVEPPGEPATVALSPSPATVNVGATLTLAATARDAASRETPTTFTWTSADPAIATVDASGTVRGIATGTATVRAAAANGVAGEVVVTVQTAPVPGGTARLSISGRNNQDPALPVGFGTQLFAQAFDANNTRLSDMAVTWSTTTPALAELDAATGVLRAKAPGRAFFVARTADGFERAWYLDLVDAPSATTAAYGNNTEFGEPTDATPDDEYLVRRPQFTASWSRIRGQSNWVAYNLDASHRGDAERCNCFTSDPLLPGDFPVITTADYVGSGYSRGHMTMSEDRTAGAPAGATSTDNARTFYLTNIIPQTNANNGGPWLKLEIYLGDLAAKQNKEVYVIAGGARYEGTLNNAGRIATPTRTWKVAVILPRDRGLGDVRLPADAEFVAVDMPNTETVPHADWQSYAVSVDSVEKLTGYDFLASLPNWLETIVEAGDRRPTARMAAVTAAAEGSAIAFDGTGSSDADVGGPLGDVLSYLWTFEMDGRAETRTGAKPSFTFPQDGTGHVRLVVSDKFGWADTVTTTVAVANVAPELTAFAGATILRGETYLASGTFADPGADTWSATVQWGADAAPQALALNGKSFSLAHAYSIAGTYTVTVRVADDDASAGRSATVVVHSAEEGVAILAANARTLVNGGVLTIAGVTVPRGQLSAGEGASLMAKLNAARENILIGERTAATNQLGAFINEIDALIGSDRLSASLGDAFRLYARRVIRAL